MKKTILALLSLFLFFNHDMSSQVNVIAVETVQEQSTQVGLNSDLTYRLMEPNQELRKNDILIDAKTEGLIEDKSLSFGFSIIGIVDYQKSNRNSKFAYLMRHPTSNN